MRLLQLELQGFKSFPEKIKLEFNKGITAVVGPNGSGKSNISDAIRFVLGEQSVKSLRGGKMEDFIFAGTDNRRALSFCEASLLLDNSDHFFDMPYAEVSVSRRLYRSGESEFSINGSSCRLKDIHAMFVDSGVGKEGYSIIGQGRIDEILSVRSEERRYMFEEVAGIVKYKNRKREALTKLERQKQNLLIVDNTISELGIQLDPLREQAERAREYLTIKEQLKYTQLCIFLHEAGKTESELASLSEKIDLAAHNEENEKSKSVELAENVSLNKEMAAQTEANLKTARDELLATATLIEHSEGGMRLYSQQIENSRANIKKLSAEISKWQKRHGESTHSLREEEERLAGLSALIDRKTGELSDMQRDYDNLSEELDAQMKVFEEQNTEIIEKIRQNSELQVDLAQKKNSGVQLDERIEKINTEKESINEQIANKEAAIGENQKRVNEANTKLSHIQRETDIAAARRLECERNKVNAEEALLKQLRREHELSSRHKLLSEMEQNHSAYYKSVRHVLKAAADNRLSGICGPVAELVRVPKEYETAIEIALGGAAQNVVTATENDAKDAIELLKRDNAGRVTFLPLTAIKSRPLADRENLSRERGYIGIASELVTFEPVYHNLFGDLLGRTAVISDMQNAISIFRKYNHNIRLVTLEGELFNPGGSISGGSTSKVNNIFSQSREIEELKQALSELVIEKRKLIHEKEKHTDRLSEIDDTLSALSDEANQLKQRINECEAERKQHEFEINSIIERKENLSSESDLLHIHRNTAYNEAAAAEERLIAAAKEITALENQIDGYRSFINTSREKKDERLNRLMEQRVGISALSENKKTVSANIDRIKNEQNEIGQRIRSDAEEIAREETIINDKQKASHAADTDIKQLGERKHELESSIEGFELLKKGLSSEIESFEAEQRICYENMTRLNLERERLQNKKEQVLFESRRLYDFVWDEYQLTFNSALEFVNGGAFADKITDTGKLERSKLTREEQRLKAQIESLGMVNINAIDEYAKVSERYEFLTVQKNDIEDANDKLAKIIDDLNGLMTTRFIEQFKLISENFNIVFKEMFGGGMAELRLSDDSDTLGSGIEMIVKPPGKKLQNMMLLSGGERALTAIALLFGILRIKPSPFCVLDEIEAALDDANVIRFAEYLSNFEKETQFILITHRKGTMEAADTLYGVTMQEKGVSKLVSVDFNEYDSESI